ncbi:DUF6216 family protein [Pantoea ananatis]|uniref:DUF6216 family protein n=1 Tax=Pantoea ananas TaxID=553 RepID=UPI001F4E26C6|nr:DUF6216 family protein [Pantoea ananatis]MCH9270063.1 DUF6216 family protein [Pantoea ananatis]
MSLAFSSVFFQLYESVDEKNFYIFAFFSFVILCFLYVRRKSKSGFSIANRVLIFLFGRNRKNQSDLIDEIIEVEKFNFYFNSYAVSKRQKDNFESWVKKYELDFRIISKMKRNLDIDTLKIKKINKFFCCSLYLILFFILFLFIQTSFIATKSYFLVNVNKTGWFWMGEHEAMEFSYFDLKDNPWIIDEKLCMNKKGIRVDFSKDTVNVICNSFGKKEDIDYIKRQVSHQKNFFWMLAGIDILFFIFLFKYAISTTLTYDARIMIYNKIKKYRRSRVFLSN